MKPFRTLNAVAVPLAESGVDTDQLCPSRFIRTPYGEGYERILLHDRRFDSEGRERPGFILNQTAYGGAQILVAGPNFGVGSSREGAVAALEGYGFRCVIAPSFGDILFDNCARRGILAFTLPEGVVTAIQDFLLARPGERLRVDLHGQSVEWEGGHAKFQAGALGRECLLEGLDAIDLSGRYATAALTYEDRVARQQPWLAAVRLPL